MKHEHCTNCAHGSFYEKKTVHLLSDPTYEWIIECPFAPNGEINSDQHKLLTSVGCTMFSELKYGEGRCDCKK